MAVITILGAGYMGSALAVIAQFAGYVHTVRATRGPSPQRAPVAPTGSSTGLVVMGKWAVIFALWGGLTAGSLALADAEIDEMGRFCARYEEVQDLPRTEMIFDLMDYVPETDQIIPIPQLIEDC